MDIRTWKNGDDPAIWEIIEPVLRAGETYALPRDWTRAQALAYWREPPHQVFVAERDGRILGTYFLTPNQKGGGAHIANCGFMTRQGETGKGIARSMALHALDQARSSGFLAMQFNLVIATNLRAIGLWESLGFKTLARLPEVFAHPHLGYVDALVMYQRL